MKKLLTISVLVASLTVSKAVDPQTWNLLASDIGSLVVTNTRGITNLSSVGVTGTNVYGIIYTNKSGTAVTVSATTQSKALVGSAPLWPVMLLDTPVIATAPWTNAQSRAQLVVSLIGGSGANTAQSWVFVPLWRDDDGNLIESNQAGDVWAVSITPNTTTVVNYAVTVPLYRWPGAYALRLKSITNGDTDASSDVIIRSAVVNAVVY